MNWRDFGAGFVLGAFGKALLKKLLSLFAGKGLPGLFKTMVDATRQQFNEDVATGKFDMRNSIRADAKQYSNPVTLRTWLRQYARTHHYHGILVQGHLAMFDYNPKYKDELEFYDTSPLVLSFGLYAAKTGNLVEYGINLHMLPQKVRENFLVDVFNAYKTRYKNVMYTTKPRPINELSWEALQIFVDKYAIDFAVRSYIPEHRSNTVIFDYADWGKALQIQSKAFVGITDQQLMKLYGQHLATRKLSKEQRQDLAEHNG